MDHHTPNQPNQQRLEKLNKHLLANPQMLEPIEALLHLVESETAMGRRADDIEADVIKHMRALGKASLQGWAEHASRASCAAARGNTHSTKKVWWISTLGRIETTEFRKRVGKAKPTRPFLESSGLANRCSSRLLCRAMVDFGIEEAFGKGDQRLLEHYGLELPSGRVRRQTLQTALKVPQTSPEPVRTLAPEGPEAIVVQIDATMVPVVNIPEHAQGDRRKQRSVAWKEARLSAAQAQGSAHTHYAAGLDTPEQAGARWTHTARAASWAAPTRIHGVGDGAEWIHTQFKQHFGAHGKYLLDMYHLSEHLAQCAPPGEDTKTWLEEKKEALKQNRSAQIIAELEARQEDASQGEEQSPVRRTHRYMSNRSEQLDYQGALERGLPIGSGLIESGHKHVLQGRLKKPGAWWLPKHAHAMAQLRVCRANGQWEQLWDN
jgi:hypothetical protein